MLLSDRQQNAVAYNPQRSTKLTPAHLSVGNEVASYLIYNVAEALIVSQTHMGGKVRWLEMPKQVSGHPLPAISWFCRSRGMAP